jgi:hypothetical protein
MKIIVSGRIASEGRRTASPVEVAMVVHAPSSETPVRAKPPSFPI